MRSRKHESAETSPLLAKEGVRGRLVLTLHFNRSSVVDGDSHFTADATEYDQERTAYVQGFGIEVLRFTNSEIWENIDGVLERIDEALQRRRATSP